jgi:hypothetical protein
LRPELFLARRLVRRFAADAPADAPPQRSSVDRKISANHRRINEANRLVLATFDGRESRKPPLVVFVLAQVEPQSAAKADRHREFWL